MNLSPKQETRSLRLLRIAGYGLLAFSIVDFIQLIIPLRLMNPEWEFQFIGALAERVALPLLGMVLVFCGDPPLAGTVEAAVLRAVSRLSLALAVFFLLLLPLGIFDTGRVRRNLESRFEAQATQAGQQHARARDLRKKLADASSATEIAAAVMSQNIPTNALDFSDPAKLKSWLLADLAQTEERLATKAATERTDTLWTLYKNAVKWNLIALLSSGLFFFIWRITRPAASQPVGLIGLLRLAGGGLLVLALFDFVHLAMPFHPLRPVWQFGLLSGSVDRVPLLLLGMVLFFFGERSGRGPQGALYLKGVAWLSLLLAIWFLLLIPYGLYGALRLNRGIDAEAAQQMARFKDSLARPAETSPPTSTPPPPATVPESVAQAREVAAAQIGTYRFEKRLALFRSASKETIGGLFAIFLFAQIYLRTRWVWREESDW